MKNMTHDEAVEELIELAESMICYVDSYFIEKYSMVTDLARLKTILTKDKEGG